MTLSSPHLSLAPTEISAATAASFPYTKQGPKKAVTLACKYTLAAAASARKTTRDDAGIQSTDKRRRYMRRGSKTPSMLLFNSFDWSMLSYDLSHKDTTPPQNWSDAHTVRLNAATKALAAASECLSNNDLEVFRAHQQQVEKACITVTVPPCATVCIDRTTLVAPLDYEQASLKTMSCLGVVPEQRQHLSLMSALKQKLETTTISSTAHAHHPHHPLHRRMSVDLVL
jgi:hypothetical protein